MSGAGAWNPSTVSTGSLNRRPPSHDLKTCVFERSCSALSRSFITFVSPGLKSSRRFLTELPASRRVTSASCAGSFTARERPAWSLIARPGRITKNWKRIWRSWRSPRNVSRILVSGMLQRLSMNWVVSIVGEVAWNAKVNVVWI